MAATSTSVVSQTTLGSAVDSVPDTEPPSLATPPTLPAIVDQLIVVLNGATVTKALNFTGDYVSSVILTCDADGCVFDPPVLAGTTPEHVRGLTSWHWEEQHQLGQSTFTTVIDLKATAFATVRGIRIPTALVGTETRSSPPLDLAQGTLREVTYDAKLIRITPV